MRSHELIDTIYIIGRGIGRVTAPIFIFLVVFGVMKTRNKPAFTAALGLIPTAFYYTLSVVQHVAYYETDNFLLGSLPALMVFISYLLISLTNLSIRPKKLPQIRLLRVLSRALDAFQ